MDRKILLRFMAKSTRDYNHAVAFDTKAEAIYRTRLKPKLPTLEFFLNPIKTGAETCPDGAGLDHTSFNSLFERAT